MGNVRYNISPCTSEEARAFIDGINRSKYISRGTVLADENSFYDRYMYTCDGERVAVVYDNRGKVISISAPKAYADELLASFSSEGKQIKKSELPSHGNAIKQDVTPDYSAAQEADKKGGDGGVRSRVFVQPKQANKMQKSTAKSGVSASTETSSDGVIAQQSTTMLITKNGVAVSTDEVYPPQRSYKKSKPKQAVIDTSPEPTPPVQYKRTYSYGTGFIETPYVPKQDTAPPAEPVKPQASNNNSVGSVIKAKSTKRTGAPRQTVISFGDDDYDAKPTAVKPHTGTGVFADIAGHTDAEPIKPRRGRPPKAKTDTEPKSAQESSGGYPIKNYPPERLSAVIKRLKSLGKYTVTTDTTEFAGTPQEVKNYSITDSVGQKVYIRYATGKHTLAIQGKRSDLFGEIQTQVSRDSDYSSALEGYVEANNVGKNKVSEVEKRLMNKLPTATAFLSEQSKIDFSYGIHDFNQTKLSLSDYSVLLVPPYRGLERFVFDLQRAEGIKVKMIGQAFDKDENGNYILKTAYQKRIGSVVYAEVMVALYTEYFSRRNFFAHSDNTDENVSRSITDKAVAKKIFDNLLSVVEYNAKKLKEIGFSMTPVD